MAPPSITSTTKALMPQPSATAMYASGFRMASLFRYRAFTVPGMTLFSNLGFS